MWNQCQIGTGSPCFRVNVVLCLVNESLGPIRLMERGFTSALSLGALLLFAARSAYAEDPATSEPQASGTVSEGAKWTEPPGLGLSPIAPPTPPALGGRAPSFGGNKDPG